MKILLVHGYAVERSKEGEGEGVVLGEFALATCQEVLRIQHHYDKIVLVGGWHVSIGSRPTIGEVMESWLVSRGLTRSIIVTQYTLGMSSRMPARETMEEVEIAKEMLQAMDLKDPAEIDVVVVWPFVQRTLFLYRDRGMNVGIKPVLIEVSQECMSSCLDRLIDTMADPGGQSPKMLEHVRGRTLDTTLTNPIR